MTPKQRQLYSQKDQRRKMLFERKHVPRIYAALQAQMAEAVNILKHAGIEELKYRLSRLVFVQDLSAVIRDLWLDAGVYYANRTRREINGSVREKKAGFGVNEEWTAAILEYFVRQLLVKAVLPISATTRQLITDTINKGQLEGWGIDRMAYELEHSDITLARARLIFRTELVMAQNYGKGLAVNDSPFETQEEWIATDDFRTRTAHNEMDGVIIKSGNRFRVPRYKRRKLVGYDLMNGPGDPSAHAENLCGCRCTSATTARRDANGNLIRKRKISVILPQARSRLPVITI
jgi:hypothetical protein